MAGAKKTIWDLSLEIAGKDTGAGAALRQVQQNMENIQNAGKQLGSDFKNFASNASKLALGVAGGVTAATAGVVSMANSFAEAGDKAAKTSAALGIGVEAYQELSYAMGQSGVSAEEFDKALQKFNLTVRQGAAGNEAAAKQLQDIGLSADKLAQMKPEQAMERLSDYMNTLPSDAERTRVAVTLFGKAAGPKMMAAMKQGSAGLKDLADEARGLGIVMSEEQAFQSELYGDAMDRLKQATTGMKNQFIGSAIGPLTEAFGHLKDAMVDQMPAIKELGTKFGQWLGSLVKRLPEIIARIKTFGTWVKDTANNVSQFLGGWKNVGKILAGVAVAPTLISGLKTVFSLGRFIQVAIGAIGPIVGGLSGGFGALAMAALPIIGIITGIVAAITGAFLIFKNWEKITAWVKEHEDALVFVGIAVGTLTAAIIAYNAAQAISNAGGIVAVTRMGAQAIATGVLAVQTSIWSTVAGIGATATTAFGAAMAFLTSPITLVVLAIGAVIAAAFLIVKNWEKVSAFFGQLWGNIKEIFSGVGSWFGDKFNSAKESTISGWNNVTSFFSNVGNKIRDGFINAFTIIKTTILNIVNTLQTMFPNAAEVVKGAFQAIGNVAKIVFWPIETIIKTIVGLFTGGLSGAVEALGGQFGKLGETVSGVFSGFKNAIDGVKGIFSGIGDKVGGFFGGIGDKFKSILPGHAEGGIFTTRHIAEIAERGAEAVVPLNRSPQGFDIWRQAGEIGGYLNRAANQQTQSGTVATQEAPPVMQAAAQKISGGENIINVNFTQSNTFNGTADKETVHQISSAGEQAADDFAIRVKEVLDDMLRNQRRVSFT